MKRTSSDEDTEVRLPEALTKEELMERYGDKLKELRVTQGDVQNIVDDTAQFHKLQENLRERRAQTNGALKLDFNYLVRERIDDMKNPTSTNELSLVLVKSTVDVQLVEAHNIASPQSVRQIFSMGECSVPSCA
jgi:YesN/AraC family two-component response regulator